ncbi:YncE family protein [Pseudomonas sp. ANT_H12B]|uniref:YncE family protein n=1 Tax=Pseudomonas sp. ANT_H12B TaxID=2597348 RepID=UPI00211642AB|nr:cytochrome D1 domain-containing protein [Pseudomonas sp. ANT_H12B]
MEAVRKRWMAVIISVALLAEAGLCLGGQGNEQGAVASPALDEPSSSDRQRLVRDGVAIEFELLPLSPDGQLTEGTLADVRFHISSAATGQPLAGLAPGVWMDPAQVREGAARDGRQLDCKARIGVYLKGVMGARPLLDLNSYYLLLLNKDPSISVIDPSISVGGITSTLSRIALKRTPMDWVASQDNKRLYVSLPDADEIAVIDTDSFQVLRYVSAGRNPVRVALQPDGHYLWVGNNATDEANSGVTVIDTRTLETVFNVPTGRGHHEIAFSEDSRYAFVSNRDSGTLSVFDIAERRHLRDIPTGPNPLSVAYSSLARAVYVADGKVGTISVIDARSLTVRKVIEAGQGLGPMRFTPDGRYGLVLNLLEDSALVIDAGNDQLIHTLQVSAEPYQLIFTRAYAYVRGLASSRVSMINLASMGQGKQPIVQAFEAGPSAPKLAGNLPLADSLTPARDEAAVFVVNPVDNTAYFYMEGMNAPMSGYLNRGHTSRAALVIDRSLRELRPGVFGARVKLPAAGKLDVAFMLNQPEMTHCFSTVVRQNPELEKLRAHVQIEFLFDSPTVPVGNEPVMARLRVVRGGSGAPWGGIKDLQIRYFLAPSSWPEVAVAQEVEAGIYEAPLYLKKVGAYYLHVRSASLQLDGDERSYASLRVLPSVRNVVERNPVEPGI